MSEFQEQCALFSWAAYAQGAYPALKLLSASLNGVRLTPAQAGKAKASGMKKGEHDVRLPVARQGYIGLSIEMKHGSNRPTEEQLAWGALLEAENWKVAYCWTWEEARTVILDYLGANPILCAQAG